MRFRIGPTVVTANARRWRIVLRSLAVNSIINIDTTRGIDLHFADAMLLKLLDLFGALNQLAMKKKRRLQPRAVQTNDVHSQTHVADRHPFSRAHIFLAHITYLLKVRSARPGKDKLCRQHGSYRQGLVEIKWRDWSGEWNCWRTR